MAHENRGFDYKHAVWGNIAEHPGTVLRRADSMIHDYGSPKRIAKSVNPNYRHLNDIKYFAMGNVLLTKAKKMESSRTAIPLVQRALRIYTDLGKEKKAKSTRTLLHRLQGESEVGAGGWYDYPSLAVAIVGILASFFFLSPNVTGNAISNMTFNNSNILGAVFFLIGVLGLFMHFKKKF